MLDPTMQYSCAYFQGTDDLAEAQRRIASEAEQLDREGGGAVDARRRLAGEKDKLADRVDALQQAAQRVGAEARGDPKSRDGVASAAAEAANSIGRETLTGRTGIPFARGTPGGGSMR